MCIVLMPYWVKTYSPARHLFPFFSPGQNLAAAAARREQRTRDDFIFDIFSS